MINVNKCLYTGVWVHAFVCVSILDVQVVNVFVVEGYNVNKLYVLCIERLT